eukprot:9497942-Pyramimonas_sp.AAC.1
MQEAELPLASTVFNPLLNVLWKSGQRLTALHMFRQAIDAQVYPNPSSQTHKLDLHELSSGAASVAIAIWLSAVRDNIMDASGDPRNSRAPQLEVVTGWGKHSRVRGSSQ